MFRVIIVRAGRVLAARRRRRLRALWPDRPGTATEDPNPLPVVLLATYGEIDVLLDGRRRVGGDCVLALGAESTCSRSPTTAPRIRRSKASCASSAHPWRALAGSTTTTATGGRRRSPHSERSPVRLYRTDVHGEVVLESDGRHIVVSTQRG